MKLRKVLTLFVVLAMVLSLALIVAACDAVSYTVTLQYDETQGTVTVNKPATGEKYLKGEAVTVTVTPEEGFAVDEVKVNDKAVQLDGEGKYTFSAEQDTVVEVKFKSVGGSEPAETFAVTTQFDSTKGTVAISAPAEGEKYAKNEQVTVTVTPNAHYVVASVKANDTALQAGSDGKYKFNVTAETVVKVEFALEELAVKLEYEANDGKVEVKGATAPYHYGDQLTVEVTPASGMKVKSFKVNGVEKQLTDGEYEFTLEVAATISVEFETAGVSVTPRDPIFDQNYNGEWTVTVEDVTYVVKIEEHAIYLTIDEGEPALVVITEYDDSFGTSKDVKFTVGGDTYEIYAFGANDLRLFFGGEVYQLSKVGGGNSDNDDVVIADIFHGTWEGVYESTLGNDTCKVVVSADGITVSFDGGMDHAAAVSGATATQIDFTLPSYLSTCTYKLTIKSQEGNEATALELTETTPFIVKVYTLTVYTDNGGGDNGDNGDDDLDEIPAIFHGTWEGDDDDYWHNHYKLVIVAEGITLYYDGGSTPYEAEISSISATKIEFEVSDLMLVLKLTVNEQASGEALSLKLEIDNEYTAILEPVENDGGNNGGDSSITFDAQYIGTWTTTLKGVSYTVEIREHTIFFNGTEVTNLKTSSFGGWEFTAEGQDWMILNSPSLSLWDANWDNEQLTKIN